MTPTTSDTLARLKAALTRRYDEVGVQHSDGPLVEVRADDLCAVLAAQPSAPSDYVGMTGEEAHDFFFKATGISERAWSMSFPWERERWNALAAEITRRALTSVPPPGEKEKDDEPYQGQEYRGPWRPIVTAPRDGEWVIVSKWREQLPTDIWKTDRMLWVSKATWSERWSSPRWWDGLEPSGLHEPTHWMPISLYDLSDLPSDGSSQQPFPPPTADYVVEDGANERDDQRPYTVEERLVTQIVGKCTCDTKTPDVSYHAVDCTYAAARMALTVIGLKDQRIEELVASQVGPIGEFPPELDAKSYHTIGKGAIRALGTVLRVHVKLSRRQGVSEFGRHLYRAMIASAIASAPPVPSAPKENEP